MNTKVITSQNQPSKQFVMQLKKINITNLKLKPRHQLDEYYEQEPLQQIKNNVDGISVNATFYIDPLSNENTQEQYVFFKLFDINNSEIINVIHNANVWSLDKITITKNKPVTQTTYLDIYQVPEETVYVQPYIVLNTKLNDTVIKCSQKQTIVLDKQQLRT